MAKVGIIGLGDFGGLAAKLILEEKDIKVFGYDIDPEKQNIVNIQTKSKLNLADLDVVCQCDYIILAVHAADLDNLLPVLSEKLKSNPEAVLISPFSMLAKPTKQVQALLENPVLPIHAMFGPTGYASQNNSLKGFKIVVPTIDYLLSQNYNPSIIKKLEAIKQRFEKRGLRVLEYSPDEHDRITARTLALHHIIGHILLDMLKDHFKVDVDKEIARMELIDEYKELALVLKSVKKANKILANLYEYNVYVPDVFDSVIQQMKALRKPQQDEDTLSQAQNNPYDNVLTFMGSVLNALSVKDEILDTKNYQSLLLLADKMSKRKEPTNTRVFADEINLLITLAEGIKLRYTKEKPLHFEFKPDTTDKPVKVPNVSADIKEAETVAERKESAPSVHSNPQLSQRKIL